MTTGMADAAALVDALTDWAREDLLAAYAVLALAVHWQEQATWHAVWGGGELRAVVARVDPSAGQEWPTQCFYAARTEAALGELLGTAPPPPGSLIFAADTPCHHLLRDVLGAGEKPVQLVYVYEGEAPPEALAVQQLSAEEAAAAGREVQPAPRAVHCIAREGRIVAMASCGFPTALTEEVRAVWVDSGWRRQGLGRAVVAAATRDTLSRGLTPVYMHDRENVASERTARSVGYRRIGELLVLSVAG